MCGNSARFEYVALWFLASAGNDIMIMAMQNAEREGRGQKESQLLIIFERYNLGGYT